MRAVEFNAYGNAADVLQLVTDLPPPVLHSDEVLIRVIATSVNPVDCAIRRGYGKEFFRARSQVGRDEFPQRLGRDSAGIVQSVGASVTAFKPGDSVYCAPTHATQSDLIAVAATEVALMPARLTFLEAAAIPFVALTVWNALVGQVGIAATSASGLRILVTRGAGGVGSFAIQLLKAWGAYVVATCRSRNVDFVRNLGADLVVDYTRQSVAEAVTDMDVVLDSSFDLQADLLTTLKMGAGSSYITIVSPKLRLIDEFGLDEGTRRANELLAEQVRTQEALGRHYLWGFMRPDGAALTYISTLVQQGLIRPIVDRVFPITQIVPAHEYCESGQAQGKIVVDMS